MSRCYAGCQGECRCQPVPEPSPAPASCNHDYQRSGYSGGHCIVIYECTKCGDYYERDVS